MILYDSNTKLMYYFVIFICCIWSIVLIDDVIHGGITSVLPLVLVVAGMACMYFLYKKYYTNISQVGSISSEYIIHSPEVVHQKFTVPVHTTPIFSASMLLLPYAFLSIYLFVYLTEFFAFPSTSLLIFTLLYIVVSILFAWLYMKYLPSQLKLYIHSSFFSLKIYSVIDMSFPSYVERRVPYFFQKHTVQLDLQYAKLCMVKKHNKKCFILAVYYSGILGYGKRKQEYIFKSFELLNSDVTIDYIRDLVYIGKTDTTDSTLYSTIKK